MSKHDQVGSMLRRERFRNRCRVSKVTTKMLFAVNFGNRTIDHFLSSEDPETFQQDRMVIHDDSQWGGPEPGPPLQIRRADQLHHVLHVIQEAAVLWYPVDLAAVFRTVDGDAVHNVTPRAPPQAVHAWCNLYQAVFSELFTDILTGGGCRDLNTRALRVPSRDSPSINDTCTRSFTTLFFAPVSMGQGHLVSTVDVLELINNGDVARAIPGPKVHRRVYCDPASNTSTDTTG